MFVKHAIHIFTHTHNAIHMIPSQAVCNKMEIDPIPYELKDLKCFKKKKLISKIILFKKIAIMHGKEKFSKNKGTI